jgi:hypothetical protein
VRSSLTRARAAPAPPGALHAAPRAAALRCAAARVSVRCAARTASHLLLRVSAPPRVRARHRSPARPPAARSRATHRTQRRGLLGASGLGVSLVSMAASRPVAAAAATPTPADILKSPAWPPEFPFGPDELSRYDEAPDSAFYSAPRFVTHIDDAAIGALTKYYASVFPPSGSKDAALLDICSSWISHYPPVRRAARADTRECGAHAKCA